MAHFLRAALERWAEVSWEPSRAGAGEGALGVSASGCCASWRSRSCSIVWASRLGGGGSACAAFAADTIACKGKLHNFGPLKPWSDIHKSRSIYLCHHVASHPNVHCTVNYWMYIR